MALFHTTVLDNQIKALPTVDTASGAIATFDTDMTENLVEVKCQIVAKQSSGTPSPDNPLPITTYTEMNVSHSGKNLFPSLDTETLNGFTVTNNNGILTLSGKASATTTFSKSFSLPAGNYNLCALNSVSGGTSYRMEITKDGNQIANAYLNSKNRNVNFTLTEYSDLIFNFYVSYNTTGGNYTLSPQITLGSGAELTFNPYTGTTANIPFGQTVANGVLDVTTGKLTDEVLKIDKNDFPTMNVSFNSEVGIIRSFYLSLPLNTRKVDSFVLSNKFASQPLSGSHAYDCEVATSGGAYTVQRVYFSISNVDYPSMTAEQAKQFLIDNDVEFYVTRYSNIVTQLDSITLQALLNENNIWCDTGDTEVKFLLSVGKKIS